MLSLRSGRSLATIVLICLVSLPVFAQVPSITSFSPSSGPTGTSVTINGANFSSTPASNWVYLGPVKATVTAASATSLTITVPIGAITAPISVTVNNLVANSFTAYTAQPFVVTFTGSGSAFTANSFGTRIDSVTGLHPYGVVIVDLDNDGKPDVATASNANPGASVAIHRNTGSNGKVAFALPAFLSVSSGALPYSIASGDIDGDGRQDLVTTNIVAKVVSVYGNLSSPGALNMLPRVDFPTGDNPYSVAIGDLDGDGKPDLAVANFLSNTVSVYRNTSTWQDISFEAKKDIVTGLAPHTVAIGDLDGDGKPELAVTNTLSGSISVFRNQSSAGTLSFSPKADFVTGTDEPSGLAIADVSGDGKPDVVVTNSNFNLITGASIATVVLRNASTPGTIAFDSKVQYGTGDTYNVALNDLNGDGKPEIITSSADQMVSVYQNTALGNVVSFAAPVYYATNSAYAVAAGDLDRDGKPDLAVANFLSQTLSFFRNKLTEPTMLSFSPAMAAQGGTITITGENFTGTTAVTVGGEPVNSFTVVNATTITAVIGAGASGDVKITTPRGTAALPGFTFIPLLTITSFSPTAGTTGTVVAITGTGFVNVSAVNFGGIPAASFTVNSATSISAVLGTGTSGAVSVTTATGNTSLPGFTFALPPTITAFTPASSTSGTLVTITGTNFNWVTVVSFGGVPAASYTIVSPTTITAVVGAAVSGNVLVSSPGGTASLPGFIYPPPVINTFAPLTGVIGATVVINGTGFSNVATENIVHFGAVSAVVQSATSTSLTVTVPAGITYEPLSVCIKGLTATATKRFALTFPGRHLFEPLSFNRVLDSATKSIGYRALMADFDNDGKPDIAQVIGDDNRSVAVYRNTSTSGNISLAAKQSFAVGLLPANMIVEDISGDGKTDIITANFSEGTVSVLKNTSIPGDISFAAKTDITVPGNAAGIAAGDMDGDGRPDLVVISQFPHILAIYRNTGVNGTVSFAAAVKVEEREWFVNALTSVAVSDLNKDGKPDVVVCDSKERTLSIFANTSVIGAVSFAAKVDYAVPGPPSRVVPADLNGDGRDDLMVSNGGALSILKNTGSGTAIGFGPADNYLAYNGNATDVTANDLDGDGLPDVAFIDGTSKMILYKNRSVNGSIQLTAETEYPSFGGGVSSGDMDGDGKPDLLLSGLAIYRNRMDERYIVWFTPTKGSEGSTVTMSGRYFTDVTAVSFGGVPAASFDVIGTTGITAIVGKGATGKVSVTTSSGVLELAGFTYMPPISVISFAPLGGGVGQTITITGTNFQDISNVFVGGVAAQRFTVVSPTTITAVLAKTASGNVTVSRQYDSAVANGFFFIPTPEISTTSYTACDSVILSSSIDTGNQWYREGVAIAGARNKTLIVKQPGHYSVAATVKGVISPMSFEPNIGFQLPPSKPVITFNTIDSTLNSSAASGNQWYMDTTTLIPAATGKSYKPTAFGLYAVKVTNVVNRCNSVFSDKFNFVLTATIDLGAGNYLKVAPNPVTDFVGITYQVTGISTLTVELTDMNGKLILARQNVRNGDKINMKGLPAGIYAIRAYSRNRKINATVQVVKL